jgi:hypothetical protein
MAAHRIGRWPVSELTKDWPRPIVKAAEGIWLRLHQTGRMPEQFGELDFDTFDDLCAQAELAVSAYEAEKGDQR